MKIITLAELVEVLKDTNKGAFATIHMQTKPKVKKGCPFAALAKRTEAKVQLGTNYENVVRTRTFDPEFVAKPAWYDHVNDWVVRGKKSGKLHLKLLLLTTKEGKPVHVVSDYINGDSVVPTESVKPHLYAKSEGGAVKLFTPAVENIKAVTVGQETFILAKGGE